MIFLFMQIWMPRGAVWLPYNYILAMTDRRAVTWLSRVQKKKAQVGENTHSPPTTPAGDQQMGGISVKK